MPAFISAEEFHELDDVIRDGWLTLQAWHEPGPITLRRRLPNGTKQDVATVTPIRIDVTSGYIPPSVGEPVTEVTNIGTMRLFTPVDVAIDDWFMIGNDRYTIQNVEDDNANHGTVVVTFVKGEGT